MFDFLLKVGAITIPVLIATIIVANRFGFSLGIRTGGNTFTNEVANFSILSWVVVALIILEVLILISLYTRLRATT